MWNAIGLVSTGLTLFAFVVAVAAVIYRRATLQKTELIKTASEKDRGRLVEAALEGFRIDTSTLGAKQKFELLMEQMKRRAERTRVAAMLIFAVFLLTAFVAIAGLMIDGGSGGATSTGTVATGASTGGADTATPTATPATATPTGAPDTATPTGAPGTGATTTGDPGTSRSTAVSTTAVPTTSGPGTSGTAAPGGKVSVLCDGKVCTITCEPPCSEVTFAAAGRTTTLPVPMSGKVTVPPSIGGKAFTVKVGGRVLATDGHGVLKVHALEIGPTRLEPRHDAVIRPISPGVVRAGGGG